MPTRIAMQWFKSNFADKVEAAVAGTPFSLEMLMAIASQETGPVWGTLHKKLDVSRILEICVGDVLDFPKRSAFPKNKAALLAVPDGQAMFDIARAALVDMAQHVPDYAPSANKPEKFCRGYGIFQLDLQFFKTDPDYFLERRWADFDESLRKCVEELHSAMRRMGIAGQSSLTDLEKVHVAIAYNAGSFKPAKGLMQGHQRKDGKFYGQLVFDFLTMANSIDAPVDPGRARLAAPTPIASTAQILEVDVKTDPLRLRSEAKVSTPENANVIARLPDGHRVRLVSPNKVGRFLEVETSLMGAHFQGFAASEFLIPAGDGEDISVASPAAAPPETGIVAVLAPRKAGTITKRTAAAGAQSLNETKQPTRKGTTPQELRDELAAIIEYLAVDKPEHIRFQPRDGLTFCNIYAHDYCHLTAVYLPRVWWTSDAIERLALGQTVEPRLGATINEQRANDLFHWLNAFGMRFGWRRTSALTKLQTAVNAGALGLIVARRKTDDKPGHIVAVVPETTEHSAKRDAAGEVIAPLQSQAGRQNFQYGTGKISWWTDEDFAESAFWLHA